jgi:hypothetical protein
MPVQYIRKREEDLCMVHENPWFLITRDELLRIEEGLGVLEKEIPAKSSRHLGAIAGVVSKVRERQP